MRRALIIGCGYTGEALAGRLAPRGVELFGTSAGGSGPATVQMRALDLTAPEPPGLPESSGAVVYYMVPTLTRVYDDSRPHLAPLEAALAAIAGHGPRGLVYLSSTSVYGDCQGAWIDEQTPTAPQSPWGKIRVELEQHVRSWGRRQGLPACVVRLPEIYGPGRGPVARLRRGYTLRFAGRYSNRIHVEDLALVLHRLGQRLDPALLLVSDGNPATTAEVYGHASRLLGQPPPPPGEPGEVDANRLALLQESKRCRNTRLMQWLGQPLRYPSYRQGLASTL